MTHWLLACRTATEPETREGRCNHSDPEVANLLNPRPTSMVPSHISGDLLAIAKFSTEITYFLSHVLFSIIISND